MRLCIAATEEASSPAASADTDSDGAGGGMAGGAFAALDGADEEDEWQTVPVKATAPAKAVPVVKEESPREPADSEMAHDNGLAGPAAQPVRVLEVSRGAPSDRGRGRGAARFAAGGGRGARDGRAAHGGRSDGAGHAVDGTAGHRADTSAARGRGPHGRGGRDRGGRVGRGRGQRGDRDSDQQASVIPVAVPAAEAAASSSPAPGPDTAAAPNVAPAASGSLERYQSSFAALADAAQRFAGAGADGVARGRGRGRHERGGGASRRGGREGYREQRPRGQDAVPESRGGHGAGDDGHSTAKAAALHAGVLSTIVLL